MNKKDKNKKLVNVRQDIIQECQNICEEFKNYTTGIRVLFLIHRNKEGGETNNTKYRKVITKGPEDFFDKLVALMHEKYANPTIPYRIYSSVNERDLKKAVREFKRMQLDADYNGEDFESFYLNIKNKVVSAFMKPSSRASTFFLFDVDNEEGRDVSGEVLHVLPNEYIVKSYGTKNGWHFVTKPFNYTTLELPKGCELKKDGLLLLKW